MSDSMFVVEPNAPQSVREAASKADMMIRAMQEGRDPYADLDASPEQAPVALPGGQGAGDGAGVVVPAPAQVEGSSDLPAAVPGTPDAQPSTDAQADDIAALRAQIEAQNQLISTWRGRFEAEVGRKAALTEQLEAMQDAIKALERSQSAQPESAPKQATGKVGDVTPLTPVELESYGEDLLEVAKRHTLVDVAERIRVATAALEARIEQLESRLTQTSTSVAQSQWNEFMERLTRRVPNWRAIDSSQPFTAWLDGFDPLFGTARRKGLESALGSYDDERVAGFFTAFLSQHKGPEAPKLTPEQPSRQPGTEQAPAGASATAPAAEQAPSLEAFAAPGGPASSQNPGSPVPPGPKIWTTTEITDFYKAKGRGDHRRDPATADRIEREIYAAQKEGRVRQA